MVRQASLQRQQRVLDAGMKLVLRNGWHATSMEAIAREAGIAKPTLYKYFADKQAIYAAVAHRLIAHLQELVENELAQAGPPERRVARALASKHKYVFRLLEGSPHANELYGDKGRFAAEAFGAFDDWLEQRIARVLTEGNQPEPLKYSRLIIAASDGIASHARAVEQIGPAIRLLVEKLLG